MTTDGVPAGGTAGLELEHHGPVALLRLRHGRVNALDRGLCDALTAAVVAREDDPGTRALVLAGSGRAFSAGVDLHALGTGSGEDVRAFVHALALCFETVLTSRLPVVAAVGGHAIAGGCVLAACADHRVVADTDGLRVGLTELAVGVPFPTVAIEVMRWRLGDPLLGPRVLLADTVPGSAAVAARLADEAVPAERVEERAVEVAGRLGALPPEVFALTKRQLQADVRERVAARRGGWEEEVADTWAAPGTRRRLAETAAALRR